MFYEHFAGSVIDFEHQVYLVFRVDGAKVPSKGIPTGILEQDIIGCAIRMRRYYSAVDKAERPIIDISINLEEAWLAVACPVLGMGLFYRVDADGSRHIWSSVSGLGQDPVAHTRHLQRVRTVFGAPQAIKEHQSYRSEHIIDRVLGRPTNLRFVDSDEAVADAG